MLFCWWVNHRRKCQWKNIYVRQLLLIITELNSWTLKLIVKFYILPFSACELCALLNEKSGMKMRIKEHKWNGFTVLVSVCLCAFCWPHSAPLSLSLILQKCLHLSVCSSVHLLFPICLSQVCLTNTFPTFFLFFTSLHQSLFFTFISLSYLIKPLSWLCSLTFSLHPSNFTDSWATFSFFFFV